MNKYRDKSDFEINKEVVKLIKTKGGYSCVDYDGIVKVYVSKNTGIYKEFDPCNNPADAMPIIIDNKISLRAPSITDRWKAEFVDEYGNYVGYLRALNKNPYRAAMEIFLMMKEAENES